MPGAVSAALRRPSGRHHGDARRRDGRVGGEGVEVEHEIGALHHGDELEALGDGLRPRGGRGRSRRRVRAMIVALMGEGGPGQDGQGGEREGDEEGERAQGGRGATEHGPGFFRRGARNGVPASRLHREARKPGRRAASGGESGRFGEGFRDDVRPGRGGRAPGRGRRTGAGRRRRRCPGRARPRCSRRSGCGSRHCSRCRRRRRCSAPGSGRPSAPRWCGSRPAAAGSGLALSGLRCRAGLRRRAGPPPKRRGRGRSPPTPAACGWPAWASAPDGMRPTAIRTITAASQSAMCRTQVMSTTCIAHRAGAPTGRFACPACPGLPRLGLRGWERTGFLAAAVPLPRRML